MKAILRTYINEAIHSEEIIEVLEGYDFGQSPYSEYNDDYCPIAIGSNQTIIEFEDN